jgi:molybdopterin-guanine dinucleotide biosynthesis protein A
VLRRAGLDPVVVVRAPGQALPSLAPDVLVVDDPREGLGPLQGIAAGLAAVADRAEVAFVCSTDLPFLHPELVRRVLRPFADNPGGVRPEHLDVVLPVARGHPQPLAAAYRTRLAPRVAALVDAQRLRAAFVLDDATVLRLDDEALLADPALRAADPTLESVVNVNEPADYATARSRPAPEVTVECFGALASRAGRGPRRVRAATVGAAALAVMLALDRHVLVAVNGDQAGQDADLPLLAGDTVAFHSAQAGR